MSNSIHQFKVKDLSGQMVDLSTYKGKVLMIVNTASECGFTPQLTGLESLYNDYKDKGFEILAFPSNDFGGQEPLEGDQIENFCQVNYGVSFKIFDKVHVKGSQQCELFQFLSDKSKNGRISSTPKWNFHKYLIDKNGEVADYYLTITKPDASKVKRKIDQLLKA